MEETFSLSSLRAVFTKPKITRYFKSLFPFMHWIRHYNLKKLSHDIPAGLTCGVMSVPQGMAYAQLAGLPPIQGLYTSFIMGIVYTFFGSSREIIVGPVSMMSVLLGSQVLIWDAHPSTMESKVYMVTFGVGFVELLLGLTRLGFVANFLSDTLIAGFTAAGGLYVITSVLAKFLGISLASSQQMYKTIWGIIMHIQEANLWTYLVGMVSLFGIIFLKRLELLNRFLQYAPGSLVVLIFGTLISWAADFHGRADIAIVGSIPKGLPKPDWYPIQEFFEYLGFAILIMIIGLAESISAAKVFAIQNNYEIDPNQELIALGLCNITASFFGGYPGTGSFTRTAVNARAGAKSPISCFIHAMVNMLTLLFLTPLFYYLPEACLASLVVAAGISLLDFTPVVKLWQVKRFELIVWTATFLTVIFWGVSEGLGVGLVVSFILVILEKAFPYTTRLGLLPDTEKYVDVHLFHTAVLEEDVLIFQMKESLMFFNSQTFKDKIRNWVRAYRHAQGCPRHDDVDPHADDPHSNGKFIGVIVDMTYVTTIDATGLHAINDLLSELKAKDLKLVFINTPVNVVNDIRTSGIPISQSCATTKHLHLIDNIPRALRDMRLEREAGHSIQVPPKLNNNNNLEDGLDNNLIQ